MISQMFILSWMVALIESDYRVINLSRGKIRGRHFATRRQKAGYLFLGIPMTEPPVGSLRFKSAVAIKPWNGTVDCFDYKCACPQDRIKVRNPDIAFHEDCLQINVVTTDYCLKKGNCSVFAFVHGGGRVFLSPSSTNNPTRLVDGFSNEDRNVIYVALPYRLNLFGYNNLAPGLEASYDSNIGHRDILFGLNWIQKEIHNFGGNPKRVTLGGHSSGATTVAEMILSPLSTGLFSQAAMFSPPYAGERNRDISSKFSQLFSIKLGCADKEETFTELGKVEKILSCLRAKTWEEILQIQLTMIDEVEQPDGVWIDGSDGFFPKTYKELLAEKLLSIPYLIGTTSAETKSSKTIINQDGAINTTKLDQICTLMAFEENYEDKEGFRKACFDYYNSIDRVCDVSDDANYYLPAGRLADKFSESGNCFVYSYEFPIKAPRFTWNSTEVSPSHAEDLYYIMLNEDENFTEEDYKRVDIHSGMLANFVNTGNPTWKGQTWTPWRKEDRNYFVIDFGKDLTMPGMKTDYHRGIADFYENITPKAAGKSQPPIDYPYRHDCYMPYMMLTSMMSVWSGHSGLTFKSDSTAHEEARLWLEHLDHLQLLEDSGASFLRLMVFFMFLVALIFIVAASVTFNRWKKKRGYVLLEGDETFLKQREKALDVNELFSYP